MHRIPCFRPGRGSNTKKIGSLCLIDLSVHTGTRSNKAANFLGDNASDESHDVGFSLPSNFSLVLVKNLSILQ